MLVNGQIADSRDSLTMLDQQPGGGTRVDQLQPNNAIMPRSADENTANTAAMSRWLAETPRQGPWNAAARMNEPGAGDRKLKSKC
jgi:hypothetical protein